MRRAIKTYFETLRWVFVKILYWLPIDVEWDERWAAWPHCMTQHQCWMHITEMADPWCRCWCKWCRLAELIRPKLFNRTRGTRWVWK